MKRRCQKLCKKRLNTNPWWCGVCGQWWTQCSLWMQFEPFFGWQYLCNKKKRKLKEFKLKDSPVWRSTDAVASSKTRIFEFLRTALAMHSSCLCPTLKFSPSVTTVASSCPSSVRTWSPSWTRPRARHNSSSEY